MHIVDTTQFFVTLAVSILSTTLVSRILLLLLRNREFGFEKLATVHGTSLALCWTLFVLWCSSPGHIYWLAGHVAFAPQAIWFMFDVLRSTDDASDAADMEAVDTDYRE
jgi:hypothetical protein